MPDIVEENEVRFNCYEGSKNDCIMYIWKSIAKSFIEVTKSFIHIFNNENVRLTYFLYYNANWEHKRTNHILSNIELEPSNEKFIRRHWIISTIQICVFQSLIFTFHARTHICWNSPFLMHCRNKIPDIYASHFSI